MPLLLLSMFFANPLPLDMPRASAYLVTEDGRQRLEDRYDRDDLWTSRTVLGRWYDDDGRAFLLARLDTVPPAIDRAVPLTRCAYAAEIVPLRRIRRDSDFNGPFLESITRLSPCPVVSEPRSPRQLVRGYGDVRYWQHPTNYSCIVCTFRLEKSEKWYFAAWELAADDDYARQAEAFEERFLRREFPAFADALPKEKPASPADEREQLRADVRHAVAAYPDWHASDAREFTVLDDLSSRIFIGKLTNDFARMRAKYAAALPSPVDGSNTLCVARIYATRDEYQEALETEGLTNMTWTAAYWCPGRRELVAYLPQGGEDQLLKTIRHEAFHQYFSYVTVMLPASIWLNEGFAQYFEDDGSEDWQLPESPTEEAIDRLAGAIPPLLAMDDEQFYAGTSAARQLKYRLAWSLVVFIEKGADEVRLKPFAGFKERYFKTLLSTGDAQKATAAAFRDGETLKLFIAEWKKFWKKR